MNVFHRAGSIGIIVFLGMFISEAFSNIFASLVRIDFDGTFPATVSYILNEEATSVVITIKRDGNVVKTLGFAASEEGTFKGPNSIQWDGSLDAGGRAGAGIYTIEILAVDEVGHRTWERISLDQGPDDWFWSPAGIAANKRQTSPFFGLVYVNERTGGTSSNPDAVETNKGLYLLDPIGLYLGFSQDSAYADGNSAVNWEVEETNSPLGVSIGPDDRVYLSVLGSSGQGGGVVVGDGLFTAASVQQLLLLQDLSNHGPVSRVAVVGAGANRVLYTCEQLGPNTSFDPERLTTETVSVLRRYRVGDGPAPYRGQPETLLSGVLLRPFDVDFDSRGFMYVVQNETPQNALATNVWGLSKWDVSVDPPIELWHTPLDSVPPKDFHAVGLIPRPGVTSPSAPAANFCGIAIDEPRRRVYVARRNFRGGPIYHVLQFNMDTGQFQEGFDQSVNVFIDNRDTVAVALIGGRGNNQRDVAVDAAGNVISVNSSSEALRIFSPPDGPNSFLTYSPWAIQIGGGDPVIPTPFIPPSAVEENGRPLQPTHYRIFQNYPNPFNAETVIQYELPINSDVDLVVYDVLGRMVVRLVQKRQTRGAYSVKWDGKDRNGNSVSSGVYVYKLTAHSSARIRRPFIVSRKMIVLR